VIARNATIFSTACGVALAICVTGCGSKSEVAKPGGTKPGGAKPVAATGAPSGKESRESTAPAGSGWGTLRGRFVYDGAAPAATPINVTKDLNVCGKHNLVDESLEVGENGGLANVVVYVRTKGVKVNPEYAKAAKSDVVLDNKNCRFEPHILPMLVTQTLVIKNSDPIAHNTNSAPIGDQAFNPIIPGGAEAKETLKKVQAIPQPVACNIHPWMKAYVLPRDDPYFAVSKPDGTFEIKDLPTGELDFQAWQEKVGYLKAPGWTNGRFKMTIKPGDNDLGTIKLSPTLFQK
jgi:hypothetical protein